MTSPRSVALTAVVLSFAFGGCNAPPRIVDLARNEQLYADIAWTTKAPGDRSVFVTPVQDVRDLRSLPDQARGFPIKYGTDDVWERPVTEMVGDVLQRQLESSKLFPAVIDNPNAQALICKPSLVSFVAGEATAMTGASSFAEVALRLQVFGPADAAGKRAILHEGVYGNRQMSEVGLNTISPYRLIGRALQISMAKALTDLDGSNCSRSSVPVIDAPATSAEPAAPNGR